jgi:hypothetical protein
MNYICIQFSNFAETQELLNLIDHGKNEIIILNKNKVRGLKHKNKIHFLDIKNIKKLISRYKQSKIVFLDKNIIYIKPESLNNLIKTHHKDISICCHSNGNNELYLAQVMGFIPDIVTKPWRDDYIDAADLNFTPIVDEMNEQLIFHLSAKIDFMNFKQYKVNYINHHVQCICLKNYDLENIIKNIKINSLSQIIYECLISKNNKHIKSGSWIVDSLSDSNQMYKIRYVNECI